MSESDLPPQPPRLKSADLPDIEGTDHDFENSGPDHNTGVAPPGWVITEPTDISTLPPSSLFDLTQPVMDESAFFEEDTQRPLISLLEPMTVLRTEYENGNQVFVKQIDWLIDRGWVGIRRTRGDGDCFYRSLAYAYISSLLPQSSRSQPQQQQDDTSIINVTKAISYLESTSALLESVGFQKLVFEDFLDLFVGVLKGLISPSAGEGGRVRAKLVEEFNVAEVSNSIVMYLRLLTSAEIRSNPDNYEPFLFHPETGEQMNTRDFCEGFVEACGKEADHVQITALTKALKVDIKVAYLDGRIRSPSSSSPSSHLADVDFVEFVNDEGIEAGDKGKGKAVDGEGIILLYRPGHYDILERRLED
ncbi:Papain-like cysteine peptidase superfamily protein [Abortiporus biennis]